jgi:GDP-D-mannose dehydratase
MAKTALITGITGQDGAFLAELLLSKGYQVHGIKRRSSLLKTDRIDHLYQDPHLGDQNFVLHYGDLSDSCSLLHNMQKDQPEDFVIATGVQRSVREFVTLTADALGIQLTWQARGIEEIAVDRAGATVVAVKPRYFRPSGVETPLSDTSYAHERLGWKPSVSLEELLKEMVGADLLLEGKEPACQEAWI